MTFESLKAFYPGNSVTPSSKCKACWTWFHFGQRIYDTKTRLFYLSVPSSTRFLSEKTYSTRNVKDKTPCKLLILNDLHNKRVLCKMYSECIVGCSSKKSRLSSECKLVANKGHILRLAKLAVKLGYHGTVTHHVSCIPGINQKVFPVCTESTFLVTKNVLEDTNADGCKVIRYSKLYNTQIRRKVKDFPTNPQIDLLLKKDSCKKVTKKLYGMLLRYASTRRQSEK